jgi:hypothetical protein
MRLCCGAYAPVVTSCLCVVCVQGGGGGPSKKLRTSGDNYVGPKVCMRLCCGAYAPVVTSCLCVVCGQGNRQRKKLKKVDSKGDGSNSRLSARHEASEDCLDGDCYLMDETPRPHGAKPCGVCVCVLVCACVCACVLRLGCSCDLRCAGDLNCRRSQRWMEEGF